MMLNAQAVSGTIYGSITDDTAAAIASHACQKYSGRVGRSAMAKEFDVAALQLAVRAHIRHAHTEYDRLLNRGTDRGEARLIVSNKVAEIEARWRCS